MSASRQLKREQRASARRASRVAPITRAPACGPAPRPTDPIDVLRLARAELARIDRLLDGLPPSAPLSPLQSPDYTGLTGPILHRRWETRRVENRPVLRVGAGSGVSVNDRRAQCAHAHACETRATTLEHVVRQRVHAIADLVGAAKIAAEAYWAGDIDTVRRLHAIASAGPGAVIARTDPLPVRVLRLQDDRASGSPTRGMRDGYVAIVSIGPANVTLEAMIADARASASAPRAWRVDVSDVD